MASSPEESAVSAPPIARTAGDSGSVVARYSNRIWRTLQGFIPSSLHAKISRLYWRPSPAHCQNMRKPCLPLPLHSNATQSLIAARASRASVILEDIMKYTTCILHTIEKSLRFWQSRAEGTNAQKIYFMIFERGPRAFVGGTYEVLSKFHKGGHPFRHLSHAASNMISINIAILSILRQFLANFLAEVYLEVDKYGGKLIEDGDKSLPSVFITINNLFLNLEASIVHSHEMCKGEMLASVLKKSSLEFHFERIPHVDLENSQWTDTEIRDATDMIYQNLQRLGSYVVNILSTCRKPTRLTIYWLQYTCGAVGISLCSIWLLRHSSLMGSNDINNWIREAKESSAGFLKDHVEQPLIAIRDELFETFRRRHKGVMATEEVQLTAESLHRMLLAFCEQTKGQKLPANIPDQEMLEIVMSRYEKEVMHPLQNLFSGELARAMLIQIQKLKLDLETAMLELDQILKANEINFAILAALPAFFLSLLLLMFVRAWLKQDRGAEGRGRVARRQRRLLVVEVEKRLVEFQACKDQGKEEDARYMYGLMLYTLDRLYKAVEKHAKETGEWLSVRQDIVDLAKPDLRTTYKLVVASRMGQMYDCLLPSSKRQ
ncbi:protein DGS1, mitochondrial isoform X1 [Canna indica]|uniref:Protein DGS1, mitochondrial isoform X1 n=1 Tax=Canna indica TaxID=4628 RepID=A0AAQ3JVA5_9LILI|nr:protein DGS1, mitochondrial isoform X1 [Canna indica]